MTRRVLLAGSTGLVGRLVRDSLAARPDIELIALGRQGSTMPGHAVDFERLRVAPEAALRPLAPEGIDVAISRPRRPSEP